jgi:predicted dehydrogenase
MSNNINKILLVGLGGMAIDYANVLKELKVPFVAVGRSAAKKKIFLEATGIDPFTGGLEEYIKTNGLNYTSAIVAVDNLQLAAVTKLLIKNGVKNILLEKPGALNPEELVNLLKEVEHEKTNVYLAYNRRFYASVLKAKEIIMEDGGVSSFQFEFTEWSHVIEKIEKPKEVKENWFFGNSTHVIDMAFYLGGEPAQMTSYKGGNIDWHPKGAIFTGAGVTKEGALFSYSANWQAPGRWGVEIMTRKSRLILRPLEKLQKQVIGSVAIEEVEIDDTLDKKFKPGLYLEVDSFLNGTNRSELKTLKQQVEQTTSWYNKICS